MKLNFKGFKHMIKIFLKGFVTLFLAYLCIIVLYFLSNNCPVISYAILLIGLIFFVGIVIDETFKSKK